MLAETSKRCVYKWETTGYRAKAPSQQGTSTWHHNNFITELTVRLTQGFFLTFSCSRPIKIKFTFYITKVFFKHPEMKLCTPIIPKQW